MTDWALQYSIHSPEDRKVTDILEKEPEEKPKHNNKQLTNVEQESIFQKLLSRSEQQKLRLGAITEMASKF